MPNLGIAPPDLTSPVGVFRVNLDDLEWSDLEPPVEGFGNYTSFSDDEISALISAGNGSVSRATGLAFLQAAGQAALQSKSVQDNDLRVDLTKRAADLRATAALWFERADDDDANDGGSDIFEVFDTNGAGGWIAEGAIPVYGRRYTWDRIR